MMIRSRALLLALGLSTFSGACTAGRPPAIPSPPPSAPCAENLLGVSSEVLGLQTPEQLRAKWVDLGLVAPGTMLQPISYDQRLVVTNLKAVQQHMERSTPRGLRPGEQMSAEVAGVVSTEGLVVSATVARSSGRIDVDLAAVRSFQELTFYPPLHGSCSIPVLARMPMTFVGPKAAAAGEARQPE